MAFRNLDSHPTQGYAELRASGPGSWGFGGNHMAFLRMGIGVTSGGQPYRVGN
jgi:hypothetical protein